MIKLTQCLITTAIIRQLNNLNIFKIEKEKIFDNINGSYVISNAIIKQLYININKNRKQKVL